MIQSSCNTLLCHTVRSSLVSLFLQRVKNLYPGYSHLCLLGSSLAARIFGLDQLRMALAAIEEKAVRNGTISENLLTTHMLGQIQLAALDVEAFQGTLSVSLLILFLPSDEISLLATDIIEKPFSYLNISGTEPCGNVSLAVFGHKSLAYKQHHQFSLLLI